MQLHYSPTSPYVRKVNVLAMECGLDASIERIPTNPWEPNEALLANNPLSKVPTLITKDGLVIFDSPVVCEYLDGEHSGDKLIPVSGKQRWQVLRTQAMCDGILDAAILRFLEGKREESLRSADWDEMQKASVTRSLNVLEAELSDWPTEISLSHICAGVVLGYLDFRFDHEDWRLDHPNLSVWYNEFSQRESMQATVPKMPS